MSEQRETGVCSQNLSDLNNQSLETMNLDFELENDPQGDIEPSETSQSVHIVNDTVITDTLNPETGKVGNELKKTSDSSEVGTEGVEDISSEKCLDSKDAMLKGGIPRTLTSISCLQDKDSPNKLTKVKRLFELNSSPHGSRESSRSMSPEVLSRIINRLPQKARSETSELEDHKEDLLSGDRDSSGGKSLKRKRRHFKGLTYSLPGVKTKKRRRPLIEKEITGENDDSKYIMEGWAEGSDDQDSFGRMTEMDNYSPASIISSKAESEDCTMYSSEIDNEESLSNTGSEFKDTSESVKDSTKSCFARSEFRDSFQRGESKKHSMEDELHVQDNNEVICEILDNMQQQIETQDSLDASTRVAAKGGSGNDMFSEIATEQDEIVVATSLEDNSEEIKSLTDNLVSVVEECLDNQNLTSKILMTDVDGNRPRPPTLLDVTESEELDDCAKGVSEDIGILSGEHSETASQHSLHDNDDQSEILNEDKDEAQNSDAEIDMVDSDHASNLLENGTEGYKCSKPVPIKEESVSAYEYDDLSRSDMSDSVDNKDNEDTYVTRKARRSLSVAESVKRRRSTRKYSDDGDMYDQYELLNLYSMSANENKSTSRGDSSLWNFVPCTCISNIAIRVNIDVHLNDEYCKALDSIDDHVIGCRNIVVDSNLRRPSQKIPFQLYCRLHLRRMKEHQCCPNCGLFCTQGKFSRCNKNGKWHLFHRKCFMSVDDKPCCPHCGETKKSCIDPIRLELKIPNSPAFYLQQYYVKSKRSHIYSLKTGLQEITKQIKNEKEYVIPETGKVLSSNDFLEDRDKDMLNNLLETLDKNEYQNIGKSSSNLYNAVLDDNLKLVLHLLSKGHDPNTCYNQHAKQTALHAAAANGNVLLVHVLHQAGASFDSRDEDLQSPLMIAACNNQYKVVKYLVEGGADLRLRGQDGLTALHMAAKFGNLESCFAILTFASDGRSLINIQDDGGWTPLVWGTEHKHTVIVRYLLKNGANPQIQDIECNTSLHWAAYSGNKDIALMFLCYGCQLDWVNVNGDTPMHIAARRDCYDCVLLFLDSNASTDVKNRDGERPIDCAALVPDSKSLAALAVSMRLKGLLPTNSKTSKRRILSNDVSLGKERIPVQCINEVDDVDLPNDYLYVSENCETSLMYVNKTITSLLVHCSCKGNCLNTSCLCCDASLQCWYDSEGRLLDSFNFNDPPMIFECNQTCKCHVAYCKNRVFQKGITIQMELFRTQAKGWGVRTLEPIPKGTYVCEYVGEIITDHEADGREDDSYLFDLDNRDSETYCIDACRYGNLARFINHQCQPNLVPVRVFVDHQDARFPRIAFFANRDISPYDELGFDYGEKFWIIKYKLFTCMCASPACKYSKNNIHETLEKYKINNPDDMSKD